MATGVSAWDELRAAAPRRILIIKPSALGDVVQALPLLPVLRSVFPASHLSWVIQSQLRDLVDGHPDLDEVFTLSRRPTVRELWRLMRTLRSSQFDLVFDLQGLARSAALTWSTGARWRVGLETAREGAHWATNLTVPQTSRHVPAHARYWRVAEVLGRGSVPRQTWLAARWQDVQRAASWLHPLPRPRLAVQWGAQWITKRWPIEGFADVLEQLLQETPASVVLVGGPSDQAECNRLAQLLGPPGPGRILDLSGQTSIKELAAVLSQVEAAIGNDSGPLHLAAQLGKPTLGIFTCTSAERSGPAGDGHLSVSTTLPCAAGYHKTCPHSGSRHLACHQEVTNARVWSALQALLARHHLITSEQRFAA